MRLIDVNAFLEREKCMEEGWWWWQVNLQTEVLKFYDTQTLEYAILSHRWGDEVDYKEMVKLTGLKKGERDKIRRRGGYQKILNSCKRAANDCIKWLWVDTCCIDKKSSSELSEAINSMYQWYENSKICYAYLHDFDGKSLPTEPDNTRFPNSNGWPEWFSRGWTLQELIAPVKLQFVNARWQPIRDKESHASDLCKITRVPEAVFRDGLTSNRPCVAQIMSWAADRQTTRVEDRAYSLLGLLDVNMPMLYGEGKKAFQRLQLEIIRKSNDQSILAWDPNGRIQWTGTSVLADDPSYFRDCHDIEKMEPHEYMIHLQESLPEAEAHSFTVADERLGTFSVTNRGIQIWLAITPLDGCSSVFFRAGLACRRNWDWRPVTIDLAFWASNYWRYPRTTRAPKTFTQLEKLYLSYESEEYPDSTFEGLDKIHSTLISRGFAYCGSLPCMIPDNRDSITLSGINELRIAVYDKECSSPRVRFAVVFGYSFGSEWLRVTQDEYEGETWKEYVAKVYNQISVAGLHHTAHSTRDSPHIHLIWPEWCGWAVKLTGAKLERSSKSASRKVIIELFQCTDEDCDAQRGWGAIKGNSDIIRLLAKMTKRTPDLSGQVHCDDRNATELRVWGQPYQGIRAPDGTPVQLKGIGFSNNNSIERSFTEPLIWSLLQHPNIHPFLGIVTTFDNTVSTVAEWIGRGNAFDYVRNTNVDPGFLLLGLAYALEYLHKHPSGPIVHGDVQGRNVLVADDGHALLTNFSCSAMPSIDTTTSPGGGDIRWMAPERILGGGKVTVKGDVWAFGMTMLELFSGKPPFSDPTGMMQIVVRITQGPLPLQPAHMADDWWDLCTSCWKRQPASRPTMSTLVQQIEELLD